MSIKVNPTISSPDDFQCRHNEWTHKIDTESGREHGPTLYFGTYGPPFGSFPRDFLSFETTPCKIVTLDTGQIADLIATMAELVGLNVVITEKEANDEHRKS